MAEKKKKQKRIFFRNVDKKGKTVLFPDVKKRREANKKRRKEAGLPPLPSEPFARQRQLSKEAGKENGHDVTEARGSGAARPQKFRKNG